MARLKWALPLAALAILSTVFLVADRRESGSALPYSDVEIDRILNEGRVANPSYSGVGTDGAAIALTAREARPGASEDQPTQVRDLVGAWETPTGARVTVAAQDGEMSDGNRQITLTGDVSVRDTHGYRMISNVLQMDLDTASVSSPGPVTATGPPGTIDAGAMRLTNGPDGATLTFTKGVRVLYDPTSSAGDPE